MLTGTTLIAIQSLMYMVQRGDEDHFSPADIAPALGASPTYLSKVNTQLVKAGILQAHRGMKGGVSLARNPKQINLLEIVEAVQGKILGDYCTEYSNVARVCGYHHAMHEIQEALVGTLRKWTLDDLLQRPGPNAALDELVNCKMACARNMAEN